MKLNESTAISTSKALLVPYESRHVPTYHAWMEDPAIQEATASERLTLEEEYENQASWRAASDKLTFIICQSFPSSSDGRTTLLAGEGDAPGRMVGDVNFFLYPFDGDDDEDAAGGEGAGGDGEEQLPRYCVGEVDIMIANHQDRGKGLGRAVVSAFLHFIRCHLGDILGEYAGDADAQSRSLGLKMLMAKIKADNAGSIALFRSLGFVQEGDVNYFGEVKLVLRDFDEITAIVPEGYTELVYTRDGDGNDTSAVGTLQ